MGLEGYTNFIYKQKGEYINTFGNEETKPPNHPRRRININRVDNTITFTN